jgi:hypothetical protein
MRSRPTGLHSETLSQKGKGKEEKRKKKEHCTIPRPGLGAGNTNPKISNCFSLMWN